MTGHPVTTTDQNPDAGRPGSPGSRWKRLGLIAGIVVVGIAALVLLGRLVADAVAGDPVANVQTGTAVEITIPPGASARSIAAALEDAGVVSARDFEDSVGRQGAANLLQAGTYELETGMEADRALEAVLAGPVFQSESSVIVVEGLRVSEIVEELADQTGHPVEAFEEALRIGAVTSPFLPSELPEGVDEITRWEGLLFPARYEIADDATPTEILGMMADEMVARMDTIDWSRLGSLGLNRYEVLTVASLIQREAGVDEERPTIASVIYNRLSQDVPLQIDASVIYALGENPGRVLSEHLEVDSPWNTYANRGLPPTPIGTVQIESLQAAADPDQTDYVFYVLVSKDGRHGFSVTYEEHQEKVQQAREDGVLP